MKEKLTKNLGMKILSLVLASILWIVIVNIDNPVIKKTFRDIRVDVINQEAVTSKGKVYEIQSGDTVDVVVRGKKRVVDSLKETDIKAEADLNNLIFTNTVEIIPSCSKAVDVSLTGKIRTMKVSIEDLDEKQFKVTIVQKGTAEDGFLIGSVKSKPNIIKVTGAKSWIAKIDQVKVEVDISNVYEDFSVNSIPKAYTADGLLLNSEKFTFSSDTVRLKCVVLKTKTVDLNVTANGEPKDGYEVTELDFEPKSIVVAGDWMTLNKIQPIPVTIDVTGASSNLEAEINLADYIPEGVVLAENSSSIMVNVKIEPIKSENIIFHNSDIEIKNLPENMECKFNNEEELNVRVSGKQNEIKELTITTLKPYIDVKALKEGINFVNVEFQQSDKFTISNNPRISVTISKKIEQEPVIPPEVNDETTNDKPDENNQENNQEQGTTNEEEDTNNPDDTENSTDTENPEVTDKTDKTDTEEVLKNKE